MTSRARRTANKAVRSTLEFAATRIASSDWLMTIAYDLMNGANFGGLAAQEEMLADTVRVQTYHRAIHRNIRRGDVVVDLGTGTGLLAFMASRAGARKVYAVEHTDFIEVARELARHNGITNIEFVQTNSREFVAPEPIDVVLHEQMGDELFNENMLENLLDLRDRGVLRPGGHILPGRFRLFVEPITMHPAERIRRFWNIDLPDDIDLGVMEHSPLRERFDTQRHEHFWARPGSVAATVGTPEPVLEFDLATLDSIESLVGDHLVERTAMNDVIVDGACVWFDAVFDDETVLTTSPLAPLTSWGNRVFRLDRDVGQGEQIRLRVRLLELTEPTTWSVDEV